MEGLTCCISGKRKVIQAAVQVVKEGERERDKCMRQGCCAYIWRGTL